MLNDNKENFLLIDLGTLLNEKLLGFNLYILHDNNFVLYRGAEVNFTEKHRQNIIAKKLNLYIEKKEKEKYIGYLKQNLKNIVDDKNINNKEKSKYYYQASRTVLAQLFSESEEVSNTKASAEILSDTAITILTASDFEMKNILENLQFEYTTFTHSLNVALIATIFAQSLGMKNEKLQSITTGALLHDIGKKEIDPKILFKPGKLEPEE